MNRLSIKDIKALLHTEDGAKWLPELYADKRKGVKKLLAAYERERKRERDRQMQYEQKQAFDRTFSLDNPRLAGVDEAGRGSLAGPVVAAAVILPNDFYLPGLTDSKQLNPAIREQYYTYITDHALQYHIGAIDQHEIDRVNIFAATIKAMKKALYGLSPPPDLALIDAVQLTGMPFRTESIIKGDDQSVAIAAASILAKVERDRMMTGMDHQFPMYGFSEHKGYGTKAHLDALKQYGACRLHRRSFSPVQKVIS